MVAAPHKCQSVSGGAKLNLAFFNAITEFLAKSSNFSFLDRESPT
jgi:hypothetical protein